MNSIRERGHDHELLQFKKGFGGWGGISIVDHLPSVGKVLSSIPGTGKKKKKAKRELGALICLGSPTSSSL